MLGKKLREIKLDQTLINDESAPYVIAEVGHNHQGDLEKALQLIRIAALSGASAVKFQKRNNKILYTPDAFNQPYNSENAFGSTYGSHREFLELGYEDYKHCINEAKKLGITFFATAFDFDSADFLNDLDMPIFKIASGDLRSLPLLKYIAKFNKPMIISTGGAEFENIELAVKTIRKYHNQVAILQCTASYPADYEQLDIKVIAKLREIYPENIIGYSGHENGIAIPIVAYTLGAQIIEKHFTLSRTLKGTDHAFSLEPQGLQKMIRDLKRSRIALGDGVKRIYETEFEPLKKMGKSIVAAKSLPVGHKISPDDFEYRSPANGLTPDRAPEIIGKIVVQSISKYEGIRLENLK